MSLSLANYSTLISESLRLVSFLLLEELGLLNLLVFFRLLLNTRFFKSLLFLFPAAIYEDNLITVFLLKVFLLFRLAIDLFK